MKSILSRFEQPDLNEKDHLTALLCTRKDIANKGRQHMTRPVMVFKWEKGDDKKFHKVEDGAGNFHSFGIDYEEFEFCPGNFSTAIVEMPDGHVRNVPVEMIRFDD